MTGKEENKMNKNIRLLYQSTLEDIEQSISRLTSDILRKQCKKQETVDVEGQLLLAYQIKIQLLSLLDNF